MLGKFEKRHFKNGEKVWLGHYKTLTNILHWHFECEIIRVTKGRSQIKIGDFVYEAIAGDTFFCVGEKLHYIMNLEDSETDVLIFSEEISKDITDLYALSSPKLSNDFNFPSLFSSISKLQNEKKEFYKQAIENKVRGFVIEVFSNSPKTKRDNKSLFYKNLISKINNESSFITFYDAVKYSGYSPSHFSKLFKKLSGMSFSEYLNIIRVQNAISMLTEKNVQNITAVSLKCGFTTVRNFNKVFKKITGYSPKSLPKDFVLENSDYHKINTFDPTDKSSELI